MGASGMIGIVEYNRFVLFFTTFHRSWLKITAAAMAVDGERGALFTLTEKVLLPRFSSLTLDFISKNDYNSYFILHLKSVTVTIN